MAERNRRSEILDAALSAFLAKGYAATTIADIREASGASTGSIYHAFKGKAAIATALFLESVEAWRAATEAAAAGAVAPRETVTASVAGLIDWGLREPARFRFMDEMRFQSALLAESPDLSLALAAGQGAAERHYGELAAKGEVRAIPWPVARALILGPAYDYLRAAAVGRSTIAPHEAKALLVEAAWDAVRAVKP